MSTGPPDPPEERPEVEPTDRPVPLDMSKDPDRFDPDAAAEPPLVARGLDPAHDPDRFSAAAAAGQGQSLPDLLGKSGTYEGERDNYQWALGLLAVFAFLAAVAFLFGSVLSPP